MRNSPISAVLSTAQKHTVRIFICSYSFAHAMSRSSERSFLRVGRLLIAHERRTISKSLAMQRLMLRRTLTAICLLPLFIRLPFLNRSIRCQKALAWFMSVLVFSLFSLLPRKAVWFMVSRQIDKVYQAFLPFRYPNTLLVDTSLSSRDILWSLMMRFCAYYDYLSSLALTSDV